MRLRDIIFFILRINLATEMIAQHALNPLNFNRVAIFYNFGTKFAL